MFFRRPVELITPRNYLIAQSTQLFMQIALGFEVARSQARSPTVRPLVSEAVGERLVLRRDPGDPLPPFEKMIGDIVM